MRVLHELSFPQQIAQPSSSGSKGNTETTIETTTEVETETAKQ